MLWVCFEPEPKASAQAVLTALKAEIFQRLQATVRHARLQLNWEVEEHKLVHLYQELLQ